MDQTAKRKKSCAINTHTKQFGHQHFDFHLEESKTSGLNLQPTPRGGVFACPGSIAFAIAGRPRIEPNSRARLYPA
jgi:hypothetical protein